MQVLRRLWSNWKTRFAIVQTLYGDKHLTFERCLFYCFELERDYMTNCSEWFAVGLLDSVTFRDFLFRLELFENKVIENGPLYNAS